MSLEWTKTFPSTPVRQVLAIVYTGVFFTVSMFCMVRNTTINETIFFVLAGSVFGIDALAISQMLGKRKTADPLVIAAEADASVKRTRAAAAATPPLTPEQAVSVAKSTDNEGAG